MSNPPSPSRRLRWGILSTGAIARSFARQLPRSLTGELTAVGSRTAEAAERFDAGSAQPRRHGSYEALLADPDVEAIYLATPHPQHALWAIRAAEAGKHILCEKPLAVNYPDAMAIVEAAQRHGVKLMEAFMYRCQPQTAKLVELLRGGAIGDVRLIQASFAFRAAADNLASRLLHPSLAGGGILDVGCYCMSAARLIAGVAKGRAFAEPIDLHAAGHLGAETGVDEYAAALLRFPGDILAELVTGVRLTAENKLRVFGTEGHLAVDSPWFAAGDQPSSAIEIFRAGEPPRRIEIPVDRPIYAYEADAFAALVRGEPVDAPYMTPEDTLGNMHALDRWRAGIGLHYPLEQAGALTRPVHGRPLRVRENGCMTYGRVPHLDKPVSRLVLGTMFEGAVLPVPHAHVLLDDFFERGGNCFDTAHVYGAGKAEELFGQWLRNRGGGALREQIVVLGKGAHTPDCHPEALTRQLHVSLERMGLDAVDIYMMHRDNPDVPAGEFVDVLNAHLRAGRVRAFGGSNWTTARVDAANEYARAHGLQGFTAVSNNFSLARMVDPVWGGCISSSDAASRAWFEQTGTALFAWSSQARGFFVRGDPAHLGDAELVRCWYAEDNFRRLERVRALASELGVEPINVAAAYVLNQPFPTFALIGPRTLSEMASTCSAVSLALTPGQMRWLNLEDA